MHRSITTSNPTIIPVRSIDPIVAVYRPTLFSMRICQLYGFHLIVEWLLGLLLFGHTVLYNVFWQFTSSLSGLPTPPLQDLPDIGLQRSPIELLFVANAVIIFTVYARATRFYPVIVLCLIGVSYNQFVGYDVAFIVDGGFNFDGGTTAYDREEFASGMILMGALAISHLYFMYIAISGQKAISLTSDTLKPLIRETSDISTFSLEPILRFSNIAPAIRYAGRKIITATLMVLSGIANFLNYWIVMAIAFAIVTVPVLYTVIGEAISGLYSHYQTYGADQNFSWNVTVLLTALFGVLLLFTVAPYFAYWVGRAASRLAQLNLRVTLERIQHLDERAPILFLRSFIDDRAEIGPAGADFQQWLLDCTSRTANLDGILFHEGTEVGPTVALGNPDDKSPPYGVIRGYFTHSNWQDAVARLCTDSRGIVLVLDDTPGVVWEIDHIIETNQRGKVLFLLPPRLIGTAAGKDLLINAISQIYPEYDTPDDQENNGTGLDRAFGLWPGLNGNGELLESSNTSAYAYRLTVRSFLRSLPGIRPA